MTDNKNRKNENTWDGDTYVYNGGKVDPEDRDKIRNVIVADSVRRIENAAFQECESLETIQFSLSSSLCEIAGYAFHLCTSLRSIEIPPSVWRIGKRAFCDCDNLRSISFSSPRLPSPLPCALTSIWFKAFCRCRRLTSIEFPNTIKILSSGAFFGCNNLKSVIFPKDTPIEKIPMCCFAGCTGLTTVVLPEKVWCLSAGSFSNCRRLSSIELPKSVAVIGRLAFESCISLESVDIPSSVREMGRSAFGGCESLKCIRLVESIQAVGESAPKLSHVIRIIREYAFAACPNLTTIAVSNSSNQLLEIDGRYFYRSNEEGALIKLPNSIHFISPKAFNGCLKLRGLLDRQSMVYECDVNKAQSLFVQKLHNTPLALRPCMLSFPPDTFDKDWSWDDDLSAKQAKIRHLSYVYYLLVRDDMLWIRQKQEQS